MRKLFRNRRTARAATTPPQDSPLPHADLDRIKQFTAHFENGRPFTTPDRTDWQYWQDGKLVPWYITLLLDHGHHVGPAIDLACKAEEPAVDRWETGVLYPNWEQTVALAQLVGVRVRDLAHPEAQPQHHENRPPHRQAGTAILSFEPDAVRDATANHSTPPPDLDVASDG